MTSTPVFDEWYETADGKDLNWSCDGHTVALTLYEVRNGMTDTSSGNTVFTAMLANT